MQLIEVVERERERRGMNHRQLSLLLGIHESLWSRIRRGEQRPTQKFLNGLMRNLPETGMAVLDYMKSGDKEKVV